MIGAIVGDIVGSRWEFGGCKSKDFQFLDCNCFATDDTFLTLAVGEALLEHEAAHGGLNVLAAHKLKEWGLAYPNVGYGESFVEWVASESFEPYNSWGNGAAMRVSFCGWAAKSLKEAEHLSDEVTKVTHNHPEGMAGARVVAGCVYLARTGCSRQDILGYVERTYRKIGFTIDEIRPTYDFDISCQGTVPQALACFFESSTFEDAIRNAISLGGDSDTLGAICGGVAGAFYGIPDGIVDATCFFLDDKCKETINRCIDAWNPSQNRLPVSHEHCDLSLDGDL